MMGRRSAVSSSKGTNPTWGLILMTSSNPGSLPEAPLPNTIMLGFQITVYESGVEDTIQSIAGSFCKVLNTGKIYFKAFYLPLSQQLPV